MNYVLVSCGVIENDPNKRLGNGENGEKDIKNHPYFDGVNWDDAKDKKLKLYLKLPQ